MDNVKVNIIIGQSSEILKSRKRKTISPRAVFPELHSGIGPLGCVEQFFSRDWGATELPGETCQARGERPGPAISWLTEFELFSQPGSRIPCRGL